MQLAGAAEEGAVADMEVGMRKTGSPSDEAGLSGVAALQPHPQHTRSISLGKTPAFRHCCHLHPPSMQTRSPLWGTLVMMLLGHLLVHITHILQHIRWTQGLQKEQVVSGLPDPRKQLLSGQVSRSMIPSLLAMQTESQDLQEGVSAPECTTEGVQPPLAAGDGANNVWHPGQHLEGWNPQKAWARSQSHGPGVQRTLRSMAKVQDRGA
ncbi:uncharacterized protein LOC119973917 [Scyliorhinus canicula]|uniref:uncharacterized protein LOC119973917 n=1 Tax=Scyliorhinus canicula TaxID=7830 RepID=UPI0018F29C1C|nr:uncharacterized protein LOC119973917 [Scyliorhinus canicula]